MEEECVTALYKSLGVSVGAEFSLEDVCVLFTKVLHQPSSQDDAVTAMKRVAGQDDNWSCTGRKVLDVLLEMDREQGRREEDFWDLQLLSAGTHTHPSTSTPETRRTSSDREDRSERGRLAEDREQGDGSPGAMWSLRRTAKQSWVRLMVDGVCSVLPSLGPGVMSERVEGAGVPTLKHVSLPELHLLVGVKYDTVSHTLRTEMLQEHLGQASWESLLPWQREEREAELGEMIEEALEKGDLLRLSDLPGAFRIYRSDEGVSSKDCPDWIKPRVEFWTAISLLTRIQASQQDEIKELTWLSQSLDQPGLQLLCLSVRLATVRVQREQQCSGALLAAAQSWQAWPTVRSPRIKEQARLLLQEGGVEGQAVQPSLWMSSQQAVLYYMVLSQEQERRYLLRLLHGVSLEDLQGLGGHSSPGEVFSQQREVVLRDACVRKMKHTRAILQTQGQTQDQTQSLESVGPSSQSQWGACALVLLTQLMEMQEAQVCAVLPSLVDMREQHLLALRKEYEHDLRNPRLNCLLTLLTTDAPPISSSLLTPDPCPEPSPPIPAQNNATAAIPEQRNVDGNRDHADGRSDRQDICTGCGETFEDLPYLEILCIPTTVDSSNTPPASSHPPTGGENGQEGQGGQGDQENQEGQEGKEGSPTKTPQFFEKQDSLIALAWSKPLKGTTEPQAAAPAASAAAVGQDSFCSVQGASPCAGDTNPPEEPGSRTRQLEVLDSSLFQCGSKAGPGHRHTEGLTDHMGQRESASVEGDQALNTPLETGECVVDLYAPTPLPHTETMGAVEAHTHSMPEEKAGMNDVPAPNQLAYLGAVGEQPADQEVDHTATEPWAQSGLDQSTVDQAESGVPESGRVPQSMLDRERSREPVSVLEREKTMRSLVDMQHKVEQKKQRDRERQLLRVRERLSIIQNRKSEEDLLGLKQKDRLRHLTHNLPQEDKSQQKIVVRERLQQLRRERSYVMQSRRDRNTAGFKELLAPVVLQGAETEVGAGMTQGYGGSELTGSPLLHEPRPPNASIPQEKEPVH